MRGGTEKRGEEDLKRKLVKVWATFKVKRIDLPEQGKGKSLWGGMKFTSSLFLLSSSC